MSTIMSPIPISLACCPEILGNHRSTKRMGTVATVTEPGPKRKYTFGKRRIPPRRGSASARQKMPWLAVNALSQKGEIGFVFDEEATCAEVRKNVSDEWEVLQRKPAQPAPPADPSEGKAVKGLVMALASSLLLFTYLKPLLPYKPSDRLQPTNFERGVRHGRGGEKGETASEMGGASLAGFTQHT